MTRSMTDTFKDPLVQTADSTCHEETAAIMENVEVNLQRVGSSGRNVHNVDPVNPATSPKETCNIATEASKVVEHVESVLGGLEVNPGVDAHNSEMASTKDQVYPGEHTPFPTPAPTLRQTTASASSEPEHAYGLNARWTEKEHGIVQALVQGGWTRKDIVTELTTGSVRLDRSEVKIGCRITMIGKEILTPAQYQGQLGTANKRARAPQSTVVNIGSVSPLQHSAQQFFASQPQQQQYQQLQCLPTAVPVAVYMLSQPQYQQQYTLPTQHYQQQHPQQSHYYLPHQHPQQSQYYAPPQQHPQQSQYYLPPQQQQHQQQHPQQSHNYLPPQRVNPPPLQHQCQRQHPQQSQYYAPPQKQQYQQQQHQQQRYQQQHLQQSHNHPNARQYPQQFWQQRAAAVPAPTAPIPAAVPAAV